MHDFTECGAGDCALEKILTCLIYKDKLLTLDEVNYEIENFSYNDLEPTNKPRPLLKAEKKIRMI